MFLVADQAITIFYFEECGMKPAQFLLSLWRSQGGEGFFCISTKSRAGRWRDTYFASPPRYAEIKRFLENNLDKNLYFCPTALTKPIRRKDYVKSSMFLWADLDEMDPRRVEPRPQIAWESSPGRYAALWRLNDSHPAKIIEDTNRALTYSIGADRGGWDLSQVLRIPGTRNYKYSNRPFGRMLWEKDNAYGLDDFPEASDEGESPEGDDPHTTFSRVKKGIKPSTIKLLTASKATVGKRSEVIWRLENELNEQGVSKNDIFTLIKHSVWNKFAGRRDEDSQLRRELGKLRNINGRPALAGAGNRKTNGHDNSGNVNGRSHDLIRRMADVEPESVSWVWYPYIPRGKVTLIEGDPGKGKSWLTLAISTTLSLRKKFFTADKFVGGRILLFSAEDGLGDTIRPRLDQLGADVNKIFAWEPAVSFDEDGCALVEEQIKELKPVLVVIDPLVAYLGGEVDLHKANETREVMARLHRMAAENNCAIIAVRHLTKGNRDKSIYRGIGSIDLTAAARSVLLVGQDPESETARVIVHIKSNLAPIGRSIRFEMRPGMKRPFRWAGTVELTAEDLLKADAKSSGGVSEYTMAKNYLEIALASGPVLSSVIRREAEARGITLKVLSRVATELNIRRGTHWRMNDD